MREVLHLAGERKGTGFAGEDAGMIHFAQLKPQDVEALRVRLGEVLSAAAPAPKRRLIELRTPPRHPQTLSPGYVSIGEVPPIEKGAGDAAATGGAAKILQGRAAVRDVLLDPSQADRKLGDAARDNAIRKAEQSSVFLVYFDLDKLALPRGAKPRKATVSFSVWDPSSRGNTKVCAFAVRTPWQESAATWRQSAESKAWKDGKSFAIGKDTAEAAGHVVVKADQGSDTVDPPLEYQIDVTGLVRAWLAGDTANYGLALAPVTDRTVDDGLQTRFQIYASEHPEAKYTPKLTILLEP